MSTLHQLPKTIKHLDRSQPAFVTAAGAVYRTAAQGGIRRCTPLDIALMSTAAATFWRIEANRQEG